MIKIHPPILEGAENALHEIFFEHRQADKIVAHYLKNNKKWGSRDRRFFAETVYEIVRWWRLILKLSDIEYSFAINDPAILDKVLTTYLAWHEKPETFAQLIGQMKRAERESIPDWLDDYCVGELGEGVWSRLLHALNQQAPQFLRVNTQKIGLDDLKIKLNEQGVQTDRVPDVETALSLKERKNVFQTQAFLDGLFEMQDAGSQLVAPFLQVLPGERVIDACAGAGGKTLHLASLMQNKGKIIALDIHEVKLNNLKLRARRAGVSIIESRVVENSKVIKRLENSADRLLLDVPCSGLGVLRRNPDTKWKLSPEDIEKTKVLQQEILDKYCKMVKVGGSIVYATCSILPSENQQQVASFLARSGEAFELEDEMSVSPFDTEFDGFYAARFKRLK